MERKYDLKGLDCANCAAKIEKNVRGIEGVEQANVDFVQQKMTIIAKEKGFEEVEEEAKTLIKKLEPDVAVYEAKKDTGEQLHEHDSQRADLIRILVSGVFLGLLFLWQPAEPWRLAAFLAVYLLIGFDVIKRAAVNIFKGQVFDENFLMSIATIGAMLIGEYPEAVAVMLFYQVGEYFQSFAVNQSRRSIRELLAIRPEVAHVQTADGFTDKRPEEVQIGQTVLIKPGERVPLDGVVIKGNSSMDTSALTGESVPKKAAAGEKILSGFINLNETILMEVDKDYQESTISKLLELVENASSKKAPAENFITKFARFYTPIVVVLAVLLAVIPPLVIPGTDASEWIYRALTFLVISCPCALVISVPLSFFGGIGGASKIGILVKGSNYLEILANTETVVFDKTGTLTKGDFTVQTLETLIERSKFLQLAASAEQYSTHPIASSILKAYDGSLMEAEKVEEISGEGIVARLSGTEVTIGNKKLMDRFAITVPDVSETGTIVYAAADKKYIGFIVIADTVKTDAKKAIYELKKTGIQKTVMLTGDAKEIAESIGSNLGIDAVYSQLLPADKVEKLEMLMKDGAKKTAFVGDGINDAPVLAQADVGIAMGGLGSDAAIEAADVVIMNDEPSKIADAIHLARKTLKIVKQNIVFAIGVKVIVLAIGALGFASMGDAVFADVGVTVLAVLNAMRCLRVKSL
ncbi:MULTISPECIES: heavy metal translocating P-type ATPase [unclassified Enterococcus]|jgi:Cd2+/Zn2+-exporting ATPase|uniref:heavy metal translocating P-type ATPase n=1 Tax=unclassified Enterococcus TaxID=2608891 RepID=UPI003D29B742